MPAKPKPKPAPPTPAPAPVPAPAVDPPRTDQVPPAPPITAAMVQTVSRLQNEVGRLNRLRTLARTNPDVAWLMAEARRQKPEVRSQKSEVGSPYEGRPLARPETS